VVAEEDALAVVRDDGDGIDGDFAAAARGVNDVLRDGVAGGVAAERFDDLDALANGGTKVMGTTNEVTLVNVVRTDARHEKLVHQRFHDGGIVVDAAQENSLVAERDASISEAFTRGARFGSQLAGMIRVDAHPQRVKLLQHRTKLRRDALRKENWDPAADAKELDVRDSANLREEMFEPFIAQEQRIPTAEQHVADFGVPANVLDGSTEIGFEVLVPHSADDAASRAVPAIRRATICHEKQDAVGIPMDEAGHDGVVVFAARVNEFAISGDGFLDAWDDLATDGAVRIGAVNEVEEVRRDGEREFLAGQQDAFAFLGRKRQQRLQRLQRGDAMTELPAPIVPVRGRDVRP